jgi:predicted SprT family Zn-dependent metalloprotease
LMDTEKARNLALSLMKRHGLLRKRPPWTLRFDRSYKTYGRCYNHYRVITLSKHYVAYASAHAVKMLILHEIAHALDCRRIAGADHDIHWKILCRKIGGVPHAFLKMPKGFPLGKWRASCHNCGRSFHFYRKPSRLYWCTPCGRTLGKLKFKKVS